MLGADVVVAELQRFTQREFEHLLRARREGDVARRRRAALADDLLDLAAHGLERDAEAFESLRGDAFTLVDQPEQDVLGADVAVIEEASLLLREHHDSAGPVGETFEHGVPFPRSGIPCVNPTGTLWTTPVSGRVTKRSRFRGIRMRRRDASRQTPRLVQRVPWASGSDQRSDSRRSFSLGLRSSASIARWIRWTASAHPSMSVVAPLTAVSR